MWGKKKAVEEPVDLDESIDEVFDDLYAELDDIVETADEPEAEVPVDFEARVAELEALLREAQEGARLARLAAKPEGLSPFKTPFESKPASKVERPRSLHRHIAPVEVEAGESRIVSQFEDEEPEEKKVYPAVWNLGYRLEELAAAVAQIIVDQDPHYHEEYAGKVHAHDFSHEHDIPPGVIVSDQEPQPEPGEEIEEGTLWYDTDRLEMFIRYDGGWITTTALGARVAEGEAKQREIESRLSQAATDIAALRADLEDRITVALWRFAGYDIDPNTLKSGEFCLQKEGLEGIGPLRIWLSVYDAGGNYWKTTTKLTASYPSSFQVSIDEPGQSGQYNGLIKEVGLNANPADFGSWESGTKHRVDLTAVYSKRSMREGYTYNINLPGYLPVYMPFSRLPATHQSDAALEGME